MRLGVIGPTGAGKSLLSQKIADYYHATLIEEPVAKSPFLPIFYNNKETMSFIAQNAFYSELFILLYKERNNENMVSDSTMFSNLVFSEQLRGEGYMDQHELELVYQIAEEGLKALPEVDVHIVIMRSNEQLLGNVKKEAEKLNRDRKPIFQNTTRIIIRF
jgi:deoxyadenosine/deoxycytidine kinase